MGGLLCLHLDGCSSGGELAEMERAWRRIGLMDSEMAMRLKLECMMHGEGRGYFVARGLRSVLLDPSISLTPRSL